MIDATLNKIVEEDLQYITSAPLPWHTLAGKTVLVSGANGHLAWYMVETLLYLNRSFPEFSNSPISVIALVRDAERAKARYQHHGDAPANLSIAVRDFQHPIEFDCKIDAIIHTASTASSVKYMRNPTDLYVANVIGTYNLLTLGVQHKIEHFLYFSSGEVYGRLSPEQIPVKESHFGQIDPTKMRSCYAECKRVAENMCACFHMQHAVPATIVRPCHTFGPGLGMVDGPVFADFIKNILDKRSITLKSDGKALRTFCYLADATLAFYTVMFKGEATQAYNVANDAATMSIGDLADLLADTFDVQVDRPDPALIKPPVEIWPDGTPNTEKLQALGWQPKTSLIDAFKRTLLSLGWCER